jgi:hypothetical protein
MNAGSDAHKVLLDFEKLVRRYGLAVVPFVDDDARATALQRLRGRTSAHASARRFFEHCVRRAPAGPLATPLTQVDLSLTSMWRQALRAELRDPDVWRVPQIIVPKSRHDAWPNSDEVQVRREDEPEAPPRVRVLARLDHYGEHPHAASDIDPWACLEKLYKPEPGARMQHPCLLPKPPCLQEVPNQALADGMARAQTLGWIHNGRYYYLPPLEHNLDEVTKEQWASARVARETRGGRGRISDGALAAGGTTCGQRGPLAS